MARQNANSIRYTKCFVAFIDVLGFEDAVRRSVRDAALRRRLTRAMNFMSEVPSGNKSSRHQDKDGNWIERNWRVQTRAFSDTVVIFMPVEAGSLSQMLFMVRYLHDRLLEVDLCMRGAVTIGGMYWNEAWSNPSPLPDQGEPRAGLLYERGRNQDFLVTLGPGLIEAYKLERECAVYPRIIVSGAIRAYAEQQRLPCGPFGPFQADRLLTDFFRVDADGIAFLDILHPAVTRNDTEKITRAGDAGGSFSIRWHRDGNTHASVMTNVRRLIASWLEQPSCPEKIRAKYEWLRTYASTMPPTTTQGEDSL